MMDKRAFKQVPTPEEVIGGRSAGDILAEAAKMFLEKNRQYGPSYLMFGDIMKALFPTGIVITGEDQFNKFGLIVQIATKLVRYTNNWPVPHQDSARDLSVYAAMLEELGERYQPKEG